MAVIEKIKGIFTGETDDRNEQINTPEQQKMVDVVQQDYSIFKAARQAMEPIWRQEQRFYQGDHWHGLRPESVSRLRPNSVDNIAWSQIEAITAKITGWMPYPDFEAQEERDEPKAALLNEYIPYELRKIKFKQKYIRAIRRMIIHGPLIFKTIHDPSVEGGRGLHRWTGCNDIIPVELGSFFPDPRIRDFIDLQDMSAVIVNTIHPIEYFRKRWPEQGKKVQSDVSDDDVNIYDDEGQSLSRFNHTSGNELNEAYTDQKTCGLIEYWYRGLPKMISREDRQMFREEAEEKFSRGIDPSESIAKAKGTMEGIHCIYISRDGVFLEHKSYVYDHGKYPFVARTLFPDEKSVWGKGFMRDMIQPQIMLNKFAEIAVSTAAKSGNSALMYEEGAIRKPNVWKEQRSLEGAMLPVANNRLNDVKELQGVNVPQTVFNMQQYYLEMLQKIPGQFDSSVGQPNPNVTSGEQAKTLISAASTRLNIVTETIQDALEDVFMQYIELIGQFYTTDRIARITGKIVSMSRDMIMNRESVEFQPNELNPVEEGEENIMDVEEEYIPSFDIHVNITVDKPHDREYWVQMAFNLLNMTDPITGLPMMDAEGVRYTLQNGRMESMKVIEERIQEKAGIMQQLQSMQQQMQQLQMENQTMQQNLMQMQSQRQNENNQQRQFENELKARKINIEEAKAQSQLMRNQNMMGGVMVGNQI